MNPSAAPLTSNYERDTVETKLEDFPNRRKCIILQFRYRTHRVYAPEERFDGTGDTHGVCDALPGK
jgi:hypothetical protein